MISPIALAVWFKSSIDRLVCFGVVLYALRNKQNVAARYGNGVFELVATGDKPARKLR